MGAFIKTEQTYNVDGARITIQNPPVSSPNDPTIYDMGPVGQEWLNTTTEQLFIYFGNNAQGQAQWQLVTQAVGPVYTLTGDTGPAVQPTAGNINVVGNAATGISTSGSGDTLTISNSNRSDVTAQTTDDTPTAMETLSVPVNSSIVVNATVLGSKADFSNSMGLIITRAFRRDAGSAAACGATVQQALCSDAPVGVTADLVLVGNSASLVVTGEAATTYNWAATFEYITIPA